MVWKQCYGSGLPSFSSLQEVMCLILEKDMCFISKKEKEVSIILLNHITIGFYRNPYFLSKSERKLSYDEFFNVVKKDKKMLIESPRV